MPRERYGCKSVLTDSFGLSFDEKESFYPIVPQGKSGLEADRTSGDRMLFYSEEPFSSRLILVDKKEATENVTEGVIFESKVSFSPRLVHPRKKVGFLFCSAAVCIFRLSSQASIHKIDHHIENVTMGKKNRSLPH